MSGHLKTYGYPSLDEVREAPGWPETARRLRGPVAVIECVQEIPCNPCEDACPRDAIKVGKPITNLPVLDDWKCTGCGLCVSKCPGLAIFIVDMTRSDVEAALSFPFEYYPLPQLGETVTAVNRAGESVCTAKVLKISNPMRNDRTPVITITIPQRYADKVRGIERKKGSDCG